jgi:hypothetical protein
MQSLVGSSLLQELELDENGSGILMNDVAGVPIQDCWG